jgi:hypothetical protein
MKTFMRFSLEVLATRRGGADSAYASLSSSDIAMAHISRCAPSRRVSTTKALRTAMGHTTSAGPWADGTACAAATVAMAGHGRRRGHSEGGVGDDGRGSDRRGGGAPGGSAFVALLSVASTRLYVATTPRRWRRRFSTAPSTLVVDKGKEASVARSGGHPPPEACGHLSSAATQIRRRSNLGSTLSRHLFVYDENRPRS